MLPKELRVQGEFPEVSYESWKAATETDLKGAPFEKKLVAHLYDGLEIEPLYTGDDWPSANDPSGFPGFAPATRGVRPMGQSLDGWAVGRELLHTHPNEANHILHEEIDGGVTSVEVLLDASACMGLDGDSEHAAGWRGREGVMIHCLGDLEETLAGVDPGQTFISMNAGASFLPAAALLVAWLEGQKSNTAETGCAFNADPLGTLMAHGTLGSMDLAMRQMTDLAAWTAKNLPNGASVLASGSVYHNAGASSLQDLAFTIGAAVDYLRAMVDAGMDVDAAARQIRFRLAVGCQFFQGLAKLRAFRALWVKALSACGAKPETASAITLVVEVSRRVLTRRDPWVNLLRNTTCCFAGAIGGADTILTLPLDAAIGPSDAPSRRLARNTQLILLKECHLHRVIDPAGGSWFLENLTDQMAEKAWAEFQAVESQGGMIRAAIDGWVGQRIAVVESQREKDIATAKAAVTGVSQHPDVFATELSRPVLNDAALADLSSDRLSDWRRMRDSAASQAALAGLSAASDGASAGLTEAAIRAAKAGATVGEMMQAVGDSGDALQVTPLVVHPYDAELEELRDSADAYTKLHDGKRPKVFLANMGTPKEFLARSTYALNFVQAGGFEPVNNDGFSEADAAANALTASGAAIAVICSTDKRYETAVEEVAPALKAAGARNVALAGNPGANQARYRQAGVDVFIFVKCDVVATLRRLLSEEGVLESNPSDD